jgi:HEAT repeat protein
MKSDDKVLRSRGLVSENEIKCNSSLEESEIISLLTSKEAYERTIAARLLVKYKTKENLELLINGLVKEKKLYTKIALSESISEFGSLASELLIKYLGKVGKNQHRELPDKEFLKNNYPLPRDIIARTIIRIEVDALPSLNECIISGEYIQKLEAVDAIGFISFYSKDDSSLNNLLLLLESSEDEVLIWKILRALQSFNDSEVIKILSKYLESDIRQFAFEAKRSLKQIERLANESKKND